METVTLDKKKYVVVEQKNKQLQILAAQKVEPQKKLSLAKGSQYANELINRYIQNN